MICDQLTAAFYTSVGSARPGSARLVNYAAVNPENNFEKKKQNKNRRPTRSGSCLICYSRNRRSAVCRSADQPGVGGGEVACKSLSLLDPLHVRIPPSDYDSIFSQANARCILLVFLLFFWRVPVFRLRRRIGRSVRALANFERAGFAASSMRVFTAITD